METTNRILIESDEELARVYESRRPVLKTITELPLSIMAREGMCEELTFEEMECLVFEACGKDYGYSTLLEIESYTAKVKELYKLGIVQEDPLITISSIVRCLYPIATLAIAQRRLNEQKTTIVSLMAALADASSLGLEKEASK